MSAARDAPRPLPLHRRAGRRGAARRRRAGPRTMLDAGAAYDERAVPARALAGPVRRGRGARRRARDELATLITSESGLCLKDTPARDRPRRRRLPVRRDRGAARRRRGVRRRHLGARPRPPRPHAARAGAAGRRDHALQPPDQPGRPQARAGDRGRRADRAEALGEGAAERARAVRDRPSRPGCPRAAAQVVCGEPAEVLDAVPGRRRRSS